MHNYHNLGIPVVLSWDSCGTELGFLWYSTGILVVLSWDSCRGNCRFVTCVRFILVDRNTLILNTKHMSMFTDKLIFSKYINHSFNIPFNLFMADRSLRSYVPHKFLQPRSQGFFLHPQHRSTSRSTSSNYDSADISLDQTCTIFVGEKKKSCLNLPGTTI